MAAKNSVERFKALLSTWTEQKRICGVLFFTPVPRGTEYAWGPPVIMEGPPSGGKTSFARQIARLFDEPCEVASPSMDGAGAFALVPTPVYDDDGNIVALTYPHPDYIDNIADGGVLLVDEFTSAEEQLMPPVHKVTCEREIGRAKLHARVRVWGACNPANMGTNVQEVSPAQASRVGWLKWTDHSVNEVCTYMANPLDREQVVSEPLSAREIEDWVMSQWPTAYAEVVALWTGFIKAKPEYKDRMPDESDPNRSRAWPCMRQWVHATHALAAARLFGLSKVEQARIVQTFVGQEAWTAWSLWMHHNDLPSVPDLLDGKVQFDFSPARLDRTMAVLSSCVSYLTTHKGQVNFDRANRMWEMFEKSSIGTRDFSWPLVQSLMKHGIGSVKAPDEAAKKSFAARVQRVGANLSPFRKARLEADNNVA